MLAGLKSSQAPAPLPTEFFSAVEAASMSGQDWDMRPHLLDKNSGQYMLLDSGAQISACPPDPGDQEDPSIAVKAVNHSRLKCYGYKNLEVRINRKTYPIVAIKTEVDVPILGWDFTRTHKLSTGWTEFGDAEIIDSKNKIKSILKYRAVPDTQPRRLSKIEAVPTGAHKPPDQLIFEVSSMAALTEETEEIISNLEALPESEFKDLLAKYPELLKLSFDKDSEEPKNGIIHRIETTGAPVRAKVRKLTPGTEKYEKGLKAIKNLEKLGIIERIDPNVPNHFTSAVHFVDKPDGTLRVVGDYRLLNQRTILDLYPLPELSSFRDHIAGSVIFSKVDLTKAFHQLLIDKRDRPKTALTTQWGMFQFRRLSMGLQNSGQSFQKLVDSVLKNIPNIFIYLDDILVFNKSKKEHLETLEQVFKKLSEAGLSINLGKCEFGVKQLDYLGFTIDRDGLRPIKKKIQAIEDFPTPLTQKQLLGFLGL